MARRLLLLLLACACGKTEGLQISISAPGVSWQDATFEIVLAAQDPMHVDDQRVMPTSLDGETVQYLTQVSTTGPLPAGSYDGATVQIEAGDAPGDYAPVALVRKGEVLVGAGTLLDTHGVPFGVAIRDDQLVTVSLAIVPLSVNAAEGPIADGQSLAVRCADRGTTSGYAWRAPGKPELRLLLPQDGTLSALDRALDLDCDGIAADAGDCDDTNPLFSPLADEACDGMDTNCDQAAQWEAPCLFSACATGGIGGVKVCDDTTGHFAGCMPDSACECASGNPDCQVCILSVDDSHDPGQPCSPSIGTIQLGLACANGCTVTAVGDVRWRADFWDPQEGNFRDELNLVGQPVTEVRLRVRHTGPDVTVDGDLASVGVTVHSSGPDVMIPITLFDDATTLDGCDEAAEDGASNMDCSGVTGD